VVQLPISANAKAVSESLNHVKSKLQGKSVYLLAADSEQGRVSHGCYVSQVSSKNTDLHDNLTLLFKY
jgi:alanyl-tRNA synthetase